MESVISWRLAKPKVLIQISHSNHELIRKRKTFLEIFPLLSVFKLFMTFRCGVIVA
jgi:hypothetical protein